MTTTSANIDTPPATCADPVALPTANPAKHPVPGGRGERVLGLFDWKSSVSGYVGAEMYLQLGGYYGATHYFDSDALTWLRQNGTKPTSAAIVNIRPDRCKVLVS